MASWREFLEREGFEKLAEAKKFVEELSVDDPEDEPYRSLYKARDIYKDVKKMLKKTSPKRRADDDLDLLWAALELKMGIIFSSTEEPATGEEHLQNCLDKMEDYKLTLKGMGIYQEALNQMGVLWTGRRKPEEALEYFKKAELLYIDFKNLIGGAPWMVDEFLAPPRTDEDKLEFERAKKMESAYTHTLFYFAQVYQQLGQADVSAQYCHYTLQRQLDSDDYDPLDWCLHAATLSQFYMTERDFTMSRHCLASSKVIFEQAEANNVNSPDEMKEKINQARADIKRCWIKYGLGLLEHSRDELLKEASQSSEQLEEASEPAADSSESISPTSQSTSEQVTSPRSTHSSLNEENLSDACRSGSQNSQAKNEQGEKEADQRAEASPSKDIKASGDFEQIASVDADTEQALEKPDQNDTNNDIGHLDAVEAERKRREFREKQVHDRFNLEVTAHEEKITDKPLKTFDDARVVFLLIKKWMEEAKEFYKLENHCPDYVALVQDHSMSFKSLAFFEPDLERQCKMQKRRIDMLTEVLKELNIQYYLLICRQLMFEIADTYSTMYDLKMAIIQAAGEDVRPTPHHVKKLNSLVSESIKFYQEYLNTLKGGKPVYPDQFPNNDERPGLVAMFCMGRLFSKFISGDVQTRLLNMKKSKDCYQFVVDYCKRNSSAAPLVESELEICKEMVQLLPAKMERVRLQAET